MDRRGLEDFREQTGSEGLPADGRREKETHRRTLAMGADNGCDGRSAESGEERELAMRLWWNWRKRDKELEKEIQHHLQMAATERRERGASVREAESGARREFGNVGLVKEVARDVWGWRWLEDLYEDARYGLRTLRKSP